ncbi:MAG: M48 family metalloprotease [Bacteroidetes bacterium]|nr:M48 family metalloprotease [Bacteroidota bacterium]
MNNFLPQTSVAVQALGWALLQSLWQCLLIYATLRLILAFVPKQHAALRYKLSLLSMAAMFLWFMDTCVEQVLRSSSTVLISQDAGTTAVHEVPIVRTSQFVPDSSIFSRLLGELQPYLPLAVAIYVMGLAVMVSRLGVNIYQLRRLRRSGFSSPARQWEEWIEARRELLRISRPVQLLYSLYAKVPMTIGTVKPIILLPVAMANNMSTEQLEPILLHELAHIRRNDYLFNILQAIVETILFFNPFIWLVSSIVRREREHCCDDMVLAHSEGPMPYAKALAALESYRLQNEIMALAATGNKNRLFNRIKRIMEMKQEKNNYTRSAIATMVIAALLICFVWLSPSFAQSHKAKSKTTSSSNTTNKAVPKAAVTPKPPKAVTEDDAAEAPDAPEASEPAEAPEPAESAMNNVNWDEINKEIEKANKEMARAGKEMANVDWMQVGKEMDQAGKEADAAAREMANIDWSSIDRDLAQAKKELDEVNWDKVNAEINKGMKEVRESIKDPKVRKQVEASLALARRESEKALAQASRSVREAQANLAQSHTISNSVVVSNGGRSNSYVYSNGGNGYSSAYSYSGGSTNAHTSGEHETMLRKMEAEGLINRSKSYKVEKYGDRLYINGVLQPEDVLRRYSKYIDAEHLTIKGNKNSIAISSSN